MSPNTRPYGSHYLIWVATCTMSGHHLNKRTNMNGQLQQDKVMNKKSFFAWVSLLAAKLYGNFWATHPAFQIDCNFGYAADMSWIWNGKRTGWPRLMCVV